MSIGLALLRTGTTIATTGSDLMINHSMHVLTPASSQLLSALGLSATLGLRLTAPA
jgi:hypothetical protein